MSPAALKLHGGQRAAFLHFKSEGGQAQAAILVGKKGGMDTNKTLKDSKAKGKNGQGRKQLTGKTLQRKQVEVEKAMNGAQELIEEIMKSVATFDGLKKIDTDIKDYTPEEV